MITDAEIDRMLVEAPAMERVRLQRLVDRIRYAEGGGVRAWFKRTLEGSHFAFMGVSSNELTRDELVGVVCFLNEKQPGWIKLAHPDRKGDGA